MHSPKVIHLSYLHQHTDPRILHKECATLARAGYEVVYVVPNIQDEVIHGVQIRAVPPVPAKNKRRQLGLVWPVYRTAIREQGDIYHFHDPLLILVGLALKLFHRKRVIYDVHENYRQRIRERLWIPRWLRYPLSVAIHGLEQLAGRLFDGIIGAIPQISALFPADRTITVHNFPDLPDNETLAVPYAQRPYHLHLGGSLGEHSQILTTLTALDQVSQANQQPHTFVIAGRFGLQAQEQLHVEHPLWQKYVKFLGWQDQDDFRAGIQQAKIGIVLYKGESYRQSFPTKLFEYMRQGLPVIASRIDNVTPVIETYQCGLIVDLTSPKVDDIAEAIHTLLRDPQAAAAMGQRGKEAVSQTYNWQIESAKLLALYERLCPINDTD